MVRILAPIQHRPIKTGKIDKRLLHSIEMSTYVREHNGVLSQFLNKKYDQFS